MIIYNYFIYNYTVTFYSYYYYYHHDFIILL